MRKNKIIKSLILCLSFILCMGTFIGCVNKTEEKTSQEKETEKKIEVYKASQNFVKEKLKAPSTAIFPKYKIGEVTVAGDNKGYTVMAYVDSENSFGAKLRSNYTCNLKKNSSGDYELEFIDIREK